MVLSHLKGWNYIFMWGCHVNEGFSLRSSSHLHFEAIAQLETAGAQRWLSEEAKS